MRNLVYLFIFVSGISFGKGIEVDTFLIQKETQIGAILKNLRSSTTDDERYMHNMDLREELKSFLVYSGVMTYPFEQWTTMSTIASPDGEFRIFNWNIEDDFGTHSHFCFLVKPSGKENTVIELVEDKITISPRPEHTLTPDHWYGALYYNIIPVKKGNKTMYTILGFNGNDRSTNRKLIDVFYFKGKNLRMGYPLFQESPGSSVLLRRVFFEYSEKAIITVRQNDKLGAIVFDHLAPESPNLEGLYDFYIPDMTYDGYQWKDGVWLYREDIIAYNDANKNIRQYRPSEDSSSTTFREVKDIWEDPVDPYAPAGGGTDATAPIEDVNNKKATTQTRNGKGKHRKFKIVNKQKGPRSAVTGERTKRNKR